MKYLLLLLLSSSCFAGYSNLGSVSDVTATAPVVSSGGTTPNITCLAASGSQAGCLSSSDWSSFNSSASATTAATSINTVSTIVKRDANGNFTANLPNAGFTLIDNFMTNTGAGNLGWAASSSGTGSGTGAETTPIVSATHSGVVGCYTGSTNSGRCSMNLGQQIIFGAGVITAESEIDIPTLSVVGDEYIFRSGIIDTGAAAPSAGVWFSYDRLNLGTHWFCNTAHATAVTAADSTVAVTAGWHKLKLIINAAGTSADFYVDGVDVCPGQTGNFPTSSDLMGIYPNGIFKSAGTSNSSTKIDYFYYNQLFTTPL